jgi:hypothetical protein
MLAFMQVEVEKDNAMPSVAPFSPPILLHSIVYQERSFPVSLRRFSYTLRDAGNVSFSTLD